MGREGKRGMEEAGGGTEKETDTERHRIMVSLCDFLINKTLGIVPGQHSELPNLLCKRAWPMIDKYKLWDFQENSLCPTTLSSSPFWEYT